jgi:hypothetical protein
VPFSAVVSASYTDYSQYPAVPGAFSETLNTYATCYLAVAGACHFGNSSTSSMDTPLFGWYKAETDSGNNVIGGTSYSQAAVPICSQINCVYASSTICAVGYGAQVDGSTLSPPDHCVYDVYACPEPGCYCGSSTCQSNVWSSCPSPQTNQVCCDGDGNSANGVAGTWTTPGCLDDSDCDKGNYCAGPGTCQAQCVSDPPPVGGGGDEGGYGDSCSTDGDCNSGLVCTNCYVCGDPSERSEECSPSDDPIIVDLSGNGFPLTSAQNGVKFDFLGNGSLTQMAWTAPGANAGWLALDRNGNGQIDNGAELFSNVTPQPGPGPKLGFRALAVYDQPANGGNGDGVIDQRDAVFSHLLVWVDKNHDGISEPGELLTMDQAGISAISLDYQNKKWVDAYGNQFRYRAKIVLGGHGQGPDHWAYDVTLVTAK